MGAVANDMLDALEMRRFLQAHGLEEMPNHEETVHRLLELEDALFAFADACSYHLSEDSRGHWHVIRKEVL